MEIPICMLFVTAPIRFTTQKFIMWNSIADRDIKNHKSTNDFVWLNPLRILEKSVDILHETKKYSWNKDNDGIIIDDEVADFDNHAMNEEGIVIFS